MPPDSFTWSRCGGGLPCSNARAGANRFCNMTAGVAWQGAHRDEAGLSVHGPGLPKRGFAPRGLAVLALHAPQ